MIVAGWTSIRCKSATPCRSATASETQTFIATEHQDLGILEDRVYVNYPKSGDCDDPGRLDPRLKRNRKALGCFIPQQNGSVVVVGRLIPARRGFVFRPGRFIPELCGFRLALGWGNQVPRGLRLPLGRSIPMLRGSGFLVVQVVYDLYRRGIVMNFREREAWRTESKALSRKR